MAPFAGEVRLKDWLSRRASQLANHMRAEQGIALPGANPRQRRKLPPARAAQLLERLRSQGCDINLDGVGLGILHLPPRPSGSAASMNFES